MSTTATKKPLSPDTGTIISLKEARQLTDNYDKHEKKKGKKKFIQGYFFGRNKIQELLDFRDDIIGIRIYYGLDIDGDGKEEKKMVIYPVDKDGNDVPFRRKPAMTVNSLMSMSFDGGNGGNGGGPNGDPAPDDGALDGGTPTP